MRASRWYWLLAGAPYAALPLIGQTTAPTKATFNKDVLPIFKAHCTDCHKGAQAPGGLDLSSAAGVNKGGVSGKLVSPGKPDASLIVMRITGQGGKPQMPMGFAPLSAEEIGKIKAWISAGAKTDDAKATHWAYVAPKSPPLPKVKDAKWVRNPIDSFVLAKLEKEGLKPSPQASKETLIRRASLDLTGLPPTLAEIDAFVNDKSPNAYEKVIDRLLASPQYGERQARIWMDLSRYADTNGYEKDRSRTAYMYRDWVINAYNQNMPYDQFVTKQLAGDLLPNCTVQDKIATGFERNTMMNEEGGVDPAEAMFSVMIDRVGTTATVFLGSTMQCCQCHDHKFDPFSQKDFYKMYAFFGNNEFHEEGDNAFGGRQFVEPELKVPNAEQAAELKKLSDKIALNDKALKAIKFSAEEYRSALRNMHWVAPTDPDVKAATGSQFSKSEEGVFHPEGATPDKDTFTYSAKLPSGKWTGIKLEVLPNAKNPSGGPGRAGNGNFVLGKLTLTVNGKSIDYQPTVSFNQPNENFEQIKDNNPDTGWAISPQFGKAHELVAAFEKPVDGDSRLEAKLEMNSRYGNHVIGDFRITFTQDADPLQDALTTEEHLAVDASTLSADQAKLLQKHWENTTPLHRENIALQRELDRLNDSIPTALVVGEKKTAGPLVSNVHVRGQFLNLGDKVTAGTPSFLPPMPAGVPGNRLGLAKWIVAKENPLTARVQVNRMWASYFGRGIVETEEDFGTQCSPPSNQELLDWLACQLRDNGWDMKRVHKLIVTSATYMQSSNATPLLMEKDPENILCSRGPRFRMEAEMIRDTVLTAAGLINLKVGGPSVMPYEPDGIWDSPYSGERWMTAKDGNRYRRSLYTFWKRTAPYPSFMALDATSRESCTVRRIRTNTPLQALALMNDKSLIEAARALADRTAGQVSPAKRVTEAFRLCTARTPTSQETARLVKLQATLEKSYRDKPEEAKKLAKGPDEAAWTMVCNVLLNLDETMTKD